MCEHVANKCGNDFGSAPIEDFGSPIDSRWSTRRGVPMNSRGELDSTSPVEPKYAAREPVAPSARRQRGISRSGFRSRKRDLAAREQLRTCCEKVPNSAPTLAETTGGRSSAREVFPSIPCETTAPVFQPTRNMRRENSHRPERGYTAKFRGKDAQDGNDFFGGLRLEQI